MLLPTIHGWLSNLLVDVCCSVCLFRQTIIYIVQETLLDYGQDKPTIVSHLSLCSAICQCFPPISIPLFRLHLRSLPDWHGHWHCFLQFSQLFPKAFFSYSPKFHFVKRDPEAGLRINMAAEPSKDRCNEQTLGYVTCPERPGPNQRFACFLFVFELLSEGSIMQPQL